MAAQTEIGRLCHLIGWGAADLAWQMDVDERTARRWMAYEEDSGGNTISGRRPPEGTAEWLRTVADYVQANTMPNGTVAGEAAFLRATPPPDWREAIQKNRAS